MTSMTVICPVVTVPVLSKHDGVDSAGRLEHLGAFDEDAELRAPSGPDEQGGRGGEPERARAGDDQHRDRGGEGAGRRGAVGEPEPERGHGDGDDDGDEHGGDAVGEALHGGLAGLCFGDEAGDLGQRGVGADPGGPHDEAAAGVDGRPGDRVTGCDLDGDALAGEHRGVDGRGAGLDDPVGGDLLARPDDEAVADGELLDRDAHLGAVSDDGDVFGAELEQGTQGGAGAALGAGLEVAAGEDEHGDDGGDLEVQLVGARPGGGGDVEVHAHRRVAGVAEEQRPQRPGERRQRAEGDEGVHRRCGVAQVGPRRLVERPGAPRDRPVRPA